MGANAKAKGGAGEREMEKWLFDNIDEIHTRPKRELGQSRDGGADIIVEPWFIIEVKRREVLDLHSWWYQVIIAQKKFPDLLPVVAFRQNKKPWEFLISAQHIQLETGFIRLRSQEFIKFANKHVEDMCTRLS